MTGVHDAEEIRVISAAPERVRLSFLGSRTQVDVSLPLDVPIAGLTPALVKFARVGDTAKTDTLEEPLAKEAKHHVWVLTRRDVKTALPADITLRQAGVAEGELLRLTAERALSAPTLYDDVVDAAARLNKAGFAGWDRMAARWMTFAGVYLSAAVWVYFLLSPAFAQNRIAMVGLSVVAALALAGVGALAYRSHGQSDIGAALGWATLPVAAADAWVALHGWGGYALAGGCAGLIVLAAVLFRAVGTGHWGYLTVAVVSGFSGLALAAHTAGVGADVTGSVLALVGTLGCRVVPWLTVRFARRKPRSRDSDEEITDHAKAIGVADVWSRMRSETLTRSALYTGLAISTVLGAWVVLTSRGTPQWPGLVFTWGCAAALGFYSQRPGAAVERAGLAFPAASLLALSCALAQDGSQSQSLAAFAALLTVILALAAIGAGAQPGHLPERLKTVLAYSTYLLTAALIPLALWVVGAYGRLGSA
jgi:type VII secretion integral membrane protein EccD